MEPERPLRIVFMGTPAFAVPSLEALLDLRAIGDRPVRVVGVFTQPDRPAGRGKRLLAPPVKDVALRAGIPVRQPERLRRPEGLEALDEMAPDLIVVAAYAQILPQRVLDLPRHGCLNVHASLLPRYRGASPIQAAILDGAAQTGVSIMQMEAGLDTGPVLAQVVEPIGADDTAESLSRRLAVAGADLLLRTLPDWIAGGVSPQAQDHHCATMTRVLRKEDGRIDWSQPAARIARLVRAMHPWPGAFTSVDGDLLKVLAADVATAPHEAAPGTVLRLGDDAAVAAGDGIVLLRSVQPAGRKPMTGADWLRGAGAAAIGRVLEANSPGGPEE